MKVTMSSFPSSYLRSRDLCSISSREDYLHKLFGILMQGKFVSFLRLFIFQYLFIAVWAHEYLYYTFCYNPMVFWDSFPCVCVCPRMQLNSDTIYSETASYYTGFRSSPVRLPPPQHTHTHTHTHLMPIARLGSSDQPAMDWRFLRPSPWVWLIC